MKKVILSCLKMNLKISHQLKSSDVFIVAPPLVKGGGGAGFLNSTKSEGNQNFSKLMGRGERGKEEFLKFSFGVGGGVGGIAGDETLNRKENFRMNLKMFS